MNEASSMPDPYRVQQGDTLGAIAKRCGKSIQELQKLNGIRNPNRINVGRTLYLSEESAYGVAVVFLDALRYPIANLPYRLLFDGQSMGADNDTRHNDFVPNKIGAD